MQTITNLMDIFVLILGTSNAWGPNEVAGASWPMSGYLADGITKIPFRRFRTSILLQTSDGKRVIIDAGPDFSHQRREYHIDHLDACFITHGHADHILGFDEFNVYIRAGLLAVPCYAQAAVWNTILVERGFQYLVDKGVVDRHDLTPYEPVHIGSAVITAFPVEHSGQAPGSVGFMFEDGGRRVGYTSDMWALSNPNNPIFRDPLDLLIIECDRWGGFAGSMTGGGHMSFQEAVRMLKDGPFSDPRPRQVTFIHFGDAGPKGLASTYQDWRESAISELRAHGLLSVMPDPDAVIAYDGMVWRP